MYNNPTSQHASTIVGGYKFHWVDYCLTCAVSPSKSNNVINQDAIAAHASSAAGEPAIRDLHARLLRAAMQCGDPVVYMEHKTLWGLEGPVDENVQVPLGRAATLRQGKDITVVSWSRQVQVCQKACEELARMGIEAELIDLRTIWPWDREAVLASCAKTGRLLVTHEAIQAGGFGAEIAATVAEHLPCKVKRLGAPRIPVGYAPVLEAQARVTVQATVQAAVQLMG